MPGPSQAAPLPGSGSTYSQAVRHAPCHARVPSSKRPFNLVLEKKIEKDQLSRVKNIYTRKHTFVHRSNRGKKCKIQFWACLGTGLGE